jgi:hypothetical protein
LQQQPRIPAENHNTNCPPGHQAALLHQLFKFTSFLLFYLSAGERLWLVGDTESLGQWDAAKAAKMKWGEGHTWSVSLAFPQGTSVTYKVRMLA